ncbi:MAG: hypothetical protein PVH17_05485 [Anaerolineae bacterium]
MPDSTVECYSGHTYAQEPRALNWEGRRHVVTEVEARWRTPDGPAFRLRTGSGDRFDVHHHELEDQWRIIKLPSYHVTNHQEDKEVQP